MLSLSNGWRVLVLSPSTTSTAKPEPYILPAQDKPALSGEEVERKCKSIIDEFLHINDYKVHIGTAHWVLLALALWGVMAQFQFLGALDVSAIREAFPGVFGGILQREHPLRGNALCPEIGDETTLSS